MTPIGTAPHGRSRQPGARRGLGYVGETAHSLGVQPRALPALADGAAIGVAVVAIRLSARSPKANALAAELNAGWLSVLSIVVIDTGIDRLVARTPVPPPRRAPDSWSRLIQQEHTSPRQASRPSQTATAEIPRPMVGSSHHPPDQAVMTPNPSNTAAAWAPQR